MTLHYATPGGVGFLLEEPEGARHQIVQGTVTDDGEFLDEWSGVRAPVWFSPDQRRFASASWTTVVDAATGGSVRLLVPGDAVVLTNPAWESDDAVLLAVQSNDVELALLRCDSESGHCEIAAESRGDVLLPESFGYDIPD